MKSDQTTLLIRLPKTLHRQLRVYAAKRGVPMSRLIRQAVQELLKQRNRKGLPDE